MRAGGIGNTRRLLAKRSGQNHVQRYHSRFSVLNVYYAVSCEIMLDQRLIDEGTFKEIYEYRLRNIVANDAICREKLVKRAAGWTRFLALLKRMGIAVDC